MLRSISTSVLAILLFAGSFAQNGTDQDTTNTPFGKGLFNKVAEDSTWYTKIAFRFQTQYEGIQIQELDEAPSEFSDRFRVRRARIKGDGWATKSRRLKYKFEYDVHNGFVLDAVIKWVFDKNKNWELWFGQTKLPGNMERVISSQKLQFVDRSLLNSRFTLDRDAGVQLHGKQKVGDNFYIKEKFAFSQGEGLNQTGRSMGYGYTARLELFPLGKFKDAYVSSDLKRHENPKLMLAVTYDYNQDAVRDRGQMGSYLNEALPLRDLQTLMADLHLKYQGLSWMVEFANKTTAEG
ncbi:MAG: porin, partial [Flavobacteriales bacterium]|nr:porin [Flavobacteriales bacterium]